MRRVQSWARNIPEPRFTTAPASGMASELLPGVRTLLVGTPETAGRTVEQSPGISVYAEGRYPRLRRGDSEVSWAAQWFGAGDYDTAAAATVWRLVENALQREWRDRSVRLYGTPATVGRDLWARSIGEHESWPVLAPEVQQLIRSTAGQGRMEVFTPGAERTVSELYEYDARLAYVALMRSLPIGEPEHLTRPAQVAAWQAGHPYAEGRYQVTWQAPEGWAHPGLLPAHGTGARDWEWPLTCEVPSWCGGAELFTALQHGWQVNYHQAHVWAHSADPLRAWCHRLTRVLASVLAEAGSRQQAHMARAAVRAILLHTVGALHGAPHKVSDVGTEPPDNALGLRRVRTGRKPDSQCTGPVLWAWYTLEQPKWPEMVHPEWSTTIWGRARARLAYSHRGQAGFLTVPADQLVAVRTDAVFMTSWAAWELDDNGDPGRWQLKGRHAGQWAWPTTGNDVLRMVGR